MAVGGGRGYPGRMRLGFDGTMHLEVGAALSELGLPDEALRAYRLAAEDPRQSCEASIRIARLMWGQGDWNGATRWLCTAMLNPNKTPEQEAVLLQELARTPPAPAVAPRRAQAEETTTEEDFDRAFDLTFG